VQAFEEKARGKMKICYNSVPWPAKGGSAEFVIGLLYIHSYECHDLPVHVANFLLKCDILKFACTCGCVCVLCMMYV
jgi:hypothetical protein